MNKDYYKYTDYHLEPGGLRKLDYFVTKILEWEKNNSSLNIKILDVGCGNGNISLPLSSLGFSVVGLDIDENSINKIKGKNIFPNLSLKIGEIDTLSEKYNIIIISEVLEHLKNPKIFLDKLKNLLSENGIILFSIPNGYSLEEQIRKILNHTSIGLKIKNFLKNTFIKKEIIQSNADSPHLHFWTWKAFNQFIENSGLQVIQRKNVAVFFKEAFYLFFRIFLKRGGWFFWFFDKIDNFWAERLFLFLGDSWMGEIKKKF